MTCAIPGFHGEELDHEWPLEPADNGFYYCRRCGQTGLPPEQHDSETEFDIGGEG